MDKAVVTVRERLQASAWHGLFSLCLLVAVLLLIYGCWYPEPLAEAAGVRQIFWLLLGVDLVLGPLLTFVVFKAHRIKWLFNLGVILILQLVALGYGVSAIERGRPVWLVFVVDDFELVTPAEIDRRMEGRFLNEYRESLLRGPRFVAANYSLDDKVAQLQRDDELFEGVSLAQRPETYAPLDTRRSDLLARAKPISKLNSFNEQQSVEQMLLSYPQVRGWLPLKGGEVDMVVLLDAHMQVLDVVGLRPWN